MRLHVKILIITGALITAGLGAALPAAAATAPPAMGTSIFACNNGVCEVGPGNVGAPFAAGLNVKIGNYTPPVERYYGACFKMTIISGSLPPGLQLSLPSSEWIVTGTPRPGRIPLLSSSPCTRAACSARRGRPGPGPSSSASPSAPAAQTGWCRSRPPTTGTRAGCPSGGSTSTSARSTRCTRPRPASGHPGPAEQQHLP